MSKATIDSIKRGRAFIWTALATALILLIPLIAMEFSSEVNWDETDFLVAGVLVFGLGNALVWVSRRVAPRWRIGICVLLALAFCLVWAELAVGIFTSLGS